MSSSILERAINTERKHTNNDFKYYENFIELQSIELVCFILTICDVVLVAEDWYTDPNLFRVIQTAEMLMPNMHVAGAVDEYIEHYPHMGMYCGCVCVCVLIIKANHLIYFYFFKFIS